MRLLRRLAALLVLSIACASMSNAHEVRPAYLQIVETTDYHFDVLWKQPALGTVAVRLVPSVSNGLLDGPPAEEFATNSFVVRRWVNRAVTRGSFDGATIRIDGLERTITDVLVSVSFANGQDIQTVLKPDETSLTVQLRGTGKASVPTYFVLGVEHILTGFDHLAFVLGLVLLVRGRMTLIKTISAFTVAHSITLAAAALGYVSVSAPVIESLVALSIVFVAVELTRAYRGRETLTVRNPWLIAFSFGLLHGFAFAGSLADIGLPAHNIPGALVLFNLGVEAGQLLFVAGVLTLMWLARALRWQPQRYARWIAAYGIGALASYWMLERIHVLLPGHV